MVSKRSGVVVLVLIAMATNATAATKPQGKQASKLLDVSLQKGGVLVGQVLNPQGKPIAATTISVIDSRQKIAKVFTDRDGNFRVTGLKGGVFRVATLQQQKVCRLWAPQTAPPAAQSGVLLVSKSEVLRAQCGCGARVGENPGCGGCCPGGVFGRGYGGGGIANWIDNHPLIVSGGIASAIAIPLAVDDDDDPPATP